MASRHQGTRSAAWKGSACGCSASCCCRCYRCSSSVRRCKSTQRDVGLRMRDVYSAIAAACASSTCSGTVEIWRGMRSERVVLVLFAIEGSLTNGEG